MSDKIIITGLKVFGYHGANRIEREHGQHFIVDVECRLDLREAGMSDLLGKTLDYDSLIKEVQRIVSMERYTLIEALAERIADAVLGHREVFSTLVRVAKPTPPIEADLEAVIVEIQRGR
ncbi:MAG: dihydroneopterin aldolase [Actinomycetota bacterium]|nr:dihydroneopterin aldolase [Actinomycetota bacterium]